MSVSEPPTNPSEVWQPLTPEELGAGTQANVPLGWDQPSVPIDWSQPPGPASWNQPSPRTDWGQVTAPANWNQASRGPMRARSASGFDDNLKVGTALLVISLVLVPIGFGAGAAYCGLRSHKAGNPLGQPFAYGALLLTILNVLFIVRVLMPLLLQ